MHPWHLILVVIWHVSHLREGLSVSFRNLRWYVCIWASGVGVNEAGSISFFNSKFHLSCRILLTNSSAKGVPRRQGGTATVIELVSASVDAAEVDFEERPGTAYNLGTAVFVSTPCTYIIVCEMQHVIPLSWHTGAAPL